MERLSGLEVISDIERADQGQEQAWPEYKGCFAVVDNLNDKLTMGHHPEAMYCKTADNYGSSD